MTATVTRRTVFVLLGCVTLATIFWNESWVLKPADPMWPHLAPFKWWLIPHVAAGIVAFVIAPLQFSATIRTHRLWLHRRLGQTYVAMATISAVFALYIGLTFEEPAAIGIALSAMAALWLTTTLLAWFAARRREIAQHRLWVMRSYGLTLTFVTTRFIPDFLPGLGDAGTAALYWGFVVGALLIPDLIVNGSAVLPWRRR